MGIGLDTNPSMVERALDQNLSMVQQDAISYLQETGSKFDVISAFHLIEHLETEDWQSLIQLAYQSLNKSGILILETPNPENFGVSSVGFYIDPTHKRPIPPDLLGFEAE